MSQFLLRAYIWIVMAVHAASPAERNSYGEGPKSFPPNLNGSSAIKEWLPSFKLVVNFSSPSRLAATLLSLWISSSDGTSKYREAHPAITFPPQYESFLLVGRWSAPSNEIKLFG